MIKISISENITDRIKSLKRELSDSRERMDIVNDVVSNKIKAAFSTKTSPNGIAWPQGKEPGTGNLFKSGRLFNSFKTGKRKAHEVEWSSPLSYDATHQFGDPSRNIPERPYLPLNKDGQIDEDTIKEIEKLINERFQKIIDGKAK